MNARADARLKGGQDLPQASGGHHVCRAAARDQGLMRIQGPGNMFHEQRVSSGLGLGAVADDFR
jgi:hypothetical protein